MDPFALISGVGSLLGARSARKAQKRFTKAMMADRAKRIEAAKGSYQKGRRGLLTENRAAMQAALAGAPLGLGASLMVGSTAANRMRSIYADFAQRAREINRDTAAGMAEYEMMSPYDIVDPSTMGQGRGAEFGAAMDIMKGLFKGGNPFSGFGSTDHGATVAGPNGQTYVSDATRGMSVPQADFNARSPFYGQQPGTTGATPGSNYIMGYPEHTFNF